MNAHDVIKKSMEMSNHVSMMYLKDLTDADWMRRPCPGCNHINWQVGHLISSEHNMVAKRYPGMMPPLPAGFDEKYGKETATCDDPKKFCSKAELLEIAQAQRAGAIAALDKLSATDLDGATGFDFAPTVGELFGLMGSHWMMHAGQWVIVRRQLGHPALF